MSNNSFQFFYVVIVVIITYIINSYLISYLRQLWWANIEPENLFILGVMLY